MEIGQVLSYVWSIMPQMMEGVKNTLTYYFAAIFPGLLLGMIFGVGKALGPPPLQKALGVYTWAWRGTPLLLQLMIALYGLPLLFGIRLPAFWVASFAFSLNMGAYITEIMRAAILSVDKGQYEACAALSIPPNRAMLRVIIPQSIRLAIPPACSEAINLVKDIALVAVVSGQDITRVANQVGGRDKTFSPFIVAFLLYLFLSSFLVKLFSILEKRATAYD